MGADCAAARDEDGSTACLPRAALQLLLSGGTLEGTAPAMRGAVEQAIVMMCRRRDVELLSHPINLTEARMVMADKVQQESMEPGGDGSVNLETMSPDELVRLAERARRMAREKSSGSVRAAKQVPVLKAMLRDAAAQLQALQARETALQGALEFALGGTPVDLAELRQMGRMAKRSTGAEVKRGRRAAGTPDAAGQHWSTERRHKSALGGLTRCAQRYKWSPEKLAAEREKLLQKHAAEEAER